MPVYFPQLSNGSIAPAGYAPSMSFKTTIQDTPSGLRTAFAWYGGALAGYPTGPLFSWKLPYKGLYESERTTLETFFASMWGRFGQFTFLDPAGNLCPYSEDFTNAAWTLGSVAVTTNGGLTDPFGGTAASLLTSSGTNGRLATPVLPSGGASGFVLCGSVWVYAAAAISLQLEFVDSTAAVLAASTTNIPANTWRRVVCPITLATANPISFQVGGGNTWGSGVALRLFGAQCASTPGPGEYAKSPGNYGLHSKVRFDQDTLVWMKTAYNQNSVDIALREYF